MPATGTEGTTDKVAARVMKPAPVTPAAPLLLSMATPSSSACCSHDRCTPVAWAMNSAARVM
jgi:hypothetical protein